MSEDDALSQQVDAWLQPVSGAERASGTEASDEILRACRDALTGKSDQFAEPVPPDYRQVAKLAEQAFEAGRDLRPAVAWLRAMLRLRGVVALAQGLRLVHGLLEQFPDDLHPLPDPDDGAQYARANALAELAAPSGLIGDLRQAVLAADRVHGEIRVRAIEIAQGRIPPREDETPPTQEYIQQFFAAYAATPQLRAALSQALAQVRALSALMDQRFGSDDDAPDLKPLAGMVQMVLGVLPAAQEASGDAAADAADGDAPEGAAGAPAAGARQSLSGQIQSRADVVRAIEMVCAYLERAEPTNPAQLLLRRARMLLEHDFLQLVQVLAPHALEDVARVMGVDPSTVAPPNSG